MSDIPAIWLFFIIACSVFLFALPLFLLAAINRKLERIAISCEASQYMLEKIDERQSSSSSVA